MADFATQFDSLGFVPGVVRGARSFSIAADGALTGIFYPQVWSAGENVAECMKGQTHGRAAISVYYLSANHVILTPPAADPPGPHGMDTCRHGFYGFYEGSDDYRGHYNATGGTASGVIEGYGEVMLGTRGFRCMKARIVALSLSQIRLASRERVGLMLERYADIPFFNSFELMIAAFPPDRGEGDATA